MSNHSLWRTLATSGRIALGALVIMAAGGHIVSALATGTVKLVWVATFADRPVLFAVLLAVWTLSLVSGVGYVVPGLNELRPGTRQPLPEK
jgi:hypothetical protein